MNIFVQNSFWSLRLTLSILYWTGFWYVSSDVTKKTPIWNYLLASFSFLFTDEMKIFIQNSFWSFRFTLTILYWSGFWFVSEDYTRNDRIWSYVRSFLFFLFVVGTYIIAQFGDLCQVWGDVPLMTGTSFLLFTNMSLGLKMFNLVWRRKEIRLLVDEADEELLDQDTDQGKAIVKRCDKEVKILLCCYAFLSFVTVAGWGTSAPKGQLPMRAWYPYDTSKSPAFELTYIHQVLAVSLGASVNVGLDTVVTSLMAQSSCRLQLLAVSLRTLGEDLVVDNKKLFTPLQVEVMTTRLHRCIRRHQSVLAASVRLQELFSASILAQVTVSMVIICVTAYQLAFETKDPVRIISMLAYFLCMTLQLFLYCYQGNQLSEESSVVAGVAYEMPWCHCPPAFQRDLLMLMMRASKVARVSALGFTTLSLSAFMSIMKASYTFFTVLRSVEDT